MKNILFILFFSWSTVASGLKEVPMLEENIPATKQKKIVNDVEINKNIKENKINKEEKTSVVKENDEESEEEIWKKKLLKLKRNF